VASPEEHLFFMAWYSCEEKYIKITNLFKQKAENNNNFFKKKFASEEKYIFLRRKAEIL